MAKVQAKAPGLVPHMYLDGEWIWYCGPSLQGAENKPVREAIKEIGFRFSFTGHVMRTHDGSPTNVKGSWGHSCLKPMRFNRSKAKGGGKAPAKEEYAGADLIGAL